MATPIKVNIEKFTENDIVNWQYVGRGGFSNVYKGLHKKLHMSCAVKHFFECVSEEEARNLLQAQNMHVIRLLGLYKETSFTTGLVLEWMPNGSVEELNKRIETGWPLRLRILYEVSLGMNLLHQQHSPMLHLDLKPANVLLDEHLHAKISDFGLAKVHQSIMKSMSDQNKEMSSNCCGTLRYMAPEMLDAGSKPTTMCDIYSYAILIWAVMTQEEPFQGASESMIEMFVKEPHNKRPTIPKQTSCPADLISLMEKCWHSQPMKRLSFQDCVPRMEAMQKTDEIKESVDKALVNLQELENMPSLKYSFCKPPRQDFHSLDVFDAKSPIQEATPPGGQDEAPGRSVYHDKPTNQEPRRVTNGMDYDFEYARMLMFHREMEFRHERFPAKT
uniref:Receptor-interacting serine-threonine kinase 3 n=1 Tax=Eptatretus burgeri TaxID=7764 RepID=A0A8C4N3F0_EPTBU